MAFTSVLIRRGPCRVLSSAPPSFIRNVKGNARSSSTTLFPLARPFSSSYFDRPAADSLLSEVVKTHFDSAGGDSRKVNIMEAENNPRMQAALYKLFRPGFAGEGIVGVDMGVHGTKCSSLYKVRGLPKRRLAVEDINPPLHIIEFFDVWCQYHTKHYTSLEKKLFSFEIFKKSCVTIWKHNMVASNRPKFLTPFCDQAPGLIVKHPIKNLERWIPGIKIVHVVKEFKNLYSRMEANGLDKPTSTKVEYNAKSSSTTRARLQRSFSSSCSILDAASADSLLSQAMSNSRLSAVLAKLSSFTGKGIIGIDLGGLNSVEKESTPPTVENCGSIRRSNRRRIGAACKIRKTRIDGYAEVDISPPIHISELFDVWCKRHNKSYPSQEEKTHRFSIFKKNCVDIWQTNRDYEEFIVWDINQFCDLSSEEMDALLLEYPAEDIERCIPGIKIEHVVKQINKLRWKHEANVYANKWRKLS